MIAGVNVSDCFLVPAHPDYPGLQGRKTVVVVVVVCYRFCITWILFCFGVKFISKCHQRQLLQTFENTFVRSVLKHPAH